MDAILTPANITFTIGLIGVMFTVYNFFRNPQEALDKKQALDQSEIDGKAALLAQQLQWEKEANEKRFTDIGLRLDQSMTLAQNHIHTVDTKADGILKMIGAMSNEITRLSTIIDERIPKGGV